MGGTERMDQPQPDGMTALHWAVFHERDDWVRRLLEAGADADVTNEYRVTPLSIACRNGNAIVGEITARGGDGSQCHAGRRRNRFDDRRAHGRRRGRRPAPGSWCGMPTQPKRKGQTALMWAAAEGNTDAVDLLLRHGCDPDQKLKSGFTAMMFAAREGHRETVARLLEAGVDVNHVMTNVDKGGRAPRPGMSALMLAVESGHFELAMFLVEHGADPNDQRSGFTPLHAITWVRKTSRGDSVDGDPPPRGSGQLHSLDFVRRIVAAGADVNAKLEKGSGGRAKLNMRGATPFLLASKTADVVLLSLLLDLGADPTIPNADGCMPLMAAAGVGVTAVGEEAGTELEVLEAIELLVGLGADPNVVDRNGETAMHGAAYRCYPQAVTLLADLGADPKVWDHKNKYGWTPQLIAAGHRPGSFKPSPETIAAIEAARR